MTPQDESSKGRDVNRWLSEARRGDAEAFSRLLTAFYPALFRMVFQIVPNFEDTEDVLQDTFFRFHRALHRVRQDSDPMPFLRTIAVRRAYSLLRRRRHDQLSLEDLPEDPADVTLSGVPVDVGKLYGWARTLPPRRRVVFILREVLGWEDAEIARMLGISETTVRRHASLAREALSAFLGS